VILHYAYIRQQVIPDILGKLVIHHDDCLAVSDTFTSRLFLYCCDSVNSLIILIYLGRSDIVMAFLDS